MREFVSERECVSERVVRVRECVSPAGRLSSGGSASGRASRQPARRRTAAASASAPPDSCECAISKMSHDTCTHITPDIVVQ